MLEGVDSKIKYIIPVTTSQGQYSTNSSWENLETAYSSLKFPNCLLNLPCWGWFNFWGAGCTTPSSIERGKLSASNLRLIPLPLFLSPSSDGLQVLVERICSFSVWISTLFLRTSCVCRTMGCWREGYDMCSFLVVSFGQIRYRLCV